MNNVKNEPETNVNTYSILREKIIQNNNVI